MDSILENRWFFPGVVLVLSVFLGYLIRSVMVRRMSAWFARTSTELDDLALKATKRYLPLWSFLAGVMIASRLANLSVRAVSAIDRLSIAVLVLTLSLAVANFSVWLVGLRTRQAGATIGTTTLAQNILRLTIFALAALLILANLGVSITPLLTALGVGSLAVALALQPTLSNLFAGLHIALSRPIRIGDYVELESGGKGYVNDIGWRATKILELSNNIIVVPNARVAEMVVKNYNLPETEQSAVVQVGVAYDSDLEKVERVTCEVARDVLRTTQGGVPDFEPFIRYNTFGESSIEFTVILRVKQFADRYLVTHEFIKRLTARYEREGIEIPLPQRILHGSVRAALAPPVTQADAHRGTDQDRG